MRGGETTILVSPPRDKSSTVRWPFHGVIILAPRGNSSTARSVFLWDSRYSAIFGYRAVDVLPRGGGTTAWWTGYRAVEEQPSGGRDHARKFRPFQGRTRAVDADDGTFGILRVRLCGH